jgi:flagellar secretion chaperone FliS
MQHAAPNFNTYRRVNVETASQGKLLIMLFNGAIQRAEEARRQLEKGSGEGVHNNLIRAQEIVAELRASLNLETGDIARQLDRIYEYYQYLLVTGNTRKAPAPIAECVDLMLEMRDTWQQVFQDQHAALAEPPKPNQHGASLVNLQG